ASRWCGSRVRAAGLNQVCDLYTVKTKPERPRWTPRLPNYAEASERSSTSAYASRTSSRMRSWAVVSPRGFGTHGTPPGRRRRLAVGVIKPSGGHADHPVTD